MKTGKTVSLAVLSTLLAACTITHGTKAPREDIPTDASIKDVHPTYQLAVNQLKTIDLVDEDDESRWTLDGKTETYNFSNLSNGKHNLAVSESYEDWWTGSTKNASGTLLAYQQPYSVVAGITWTQDSGGYHKVNTFSHDRTKMVRGLPTALLHEHIPGHANVIPSLVMDKAVFDYNGKAFNGEEEGTLAYTVDFGLQKGSGSISGIESTGLITLQSADLNTANGFIAGTAKMPKYELVAGESVLYELGLFGPNADEVAGSVSMYDLSDLNQPGRNTVIFGGAREVEK